MFPTINLTSNRNFSIRNFEEDKNATLAANPGLRFEGKIKLGYKFGGIFLLKNHNSELIESFDIEIIVPKKYPNVFPFVFLKDNKVERIEEFHISPEGLICLEHTYICNALAYSGIRLYDFINYYLAKYFSWILVKKYGDSSRLEEWAHQGSGTKQLFETLLGTTDKDKILNFVSNYCNVQKSRRNDKCYCGSNKKLKKCHESEVKFLSKTMKEQIIKDIDILYE